MTGNFLLNTQSLILKTLCRNIRNDRYTINIEKIYLPQTILGIIIRLIQRHRTCVKGNYRNCHCSFSLSIFCNVCVRKLMLCSVVINFCNFFRNHLGTGHFTVFSISGVALYRMTSFEDVHSSGETYFNEDLRELTLDSIISFHSSRTKFSGDARLV